MTNNNQESTLEFQVVENATILPCEYKNGKSYSGIFDAQDRLVPDSLLVRKDLFGHDKQVILAKENYALTKMIPQSNLNDTYIFAGYLTGHYGHFLIENLARFWYIKQYPQLPIIWIPFTGMINQNFKSWQKEIFSLLKINNPQIIIEKPTSVKQLIIPQPGCGIHDYFYLQQAQALIALKAENPQKGRKIWLSRSQLDPKRSLSSVDNEKQLEQILELQGWFIFHPQEHSIKQQLEMLVSSEHIAGFQGSAFHTLIFLDQFKAKINIFRRRYLPNQQIVNDTYTNIAKTKQLKQTEHFVSQTKIRERTQNYGASVYLIHSYRQIIDLLNNED